MLSDEDGRNASNPISSMAEHRTCGFVTEGL
jgi:hypothetical protein